MRQLTRHELVGHCEATPLTGGADDGGEHGAEHFAGDVDEWAA
jgi:hypothetical protein